LLAEQGRPGRKADHGQLRIRGAGEVSYSEIAAPTLPPLTLGRERRPRRRLEIGIDPRPRGPHVTLGRVPGRAPPRKRVSHTGMVEDRIGSKTSLEVPFWWKFLFGWKTHSSHFDLADGLASCFEELPTRTFDRRSALHHRRPAKIKIVGEQGICALDFFFHTGSESSSERRVALMRLP